MTTTTATRIGPKMSLAEAEVIAQPGILQYKLAELVGPNGSNRYGTAIVKRAVRAGLIVPVEGVERGRRVIRYYPVD